MQNFHPRHFAIVPAAGSGSRMGAEKPKLYLPLLGKPLIYHSLSVLCAAPEMMSGVRASSIRIESSSSTMA